MALVIESGISVGGGINIASIFPFSPTSATLVYDLDAANFSAVPTNGVSKDATGTYTLTVTNAGSISWKSASGGYFEKNNSVGTDTIIGGPNYATGQSYTVFSAYQVDSRSGGRLLNTTNEVPTDWTTGSYFNGSYFKNVFYPAATVNLTSDAYTTNSGWNFLWGLYNTTTGWANLFIASSTVNNVSGPSSVYKSVLFSAGSTHGFNQLRLWSRNGGVEVQTGNIGFVKVYNGTLSTADIQGLWTQYHTRFGI